MRALFGRKWQPILVYRLLEDGPTGFSRLKRDIDGISSKMLSESLTDLEDRGLVERTQVEDSPVRVEYALTERGETLEPVLREMVQWGSEQTIEGAGQPDDSQETWGQRA
jgi:DNA-binding HxlR family transcriptional regulator